MKICPLCNLEKDIDLFGRRRGNGLQSYCKTCLYKSQMRRWNLNKIKAIEYLGGLCKECGKSGHPVTFDFHHRNPSEKEFQWDILRKKSWEKMVHELDKCDLVHGDCHRLKHIDPSLWPESV